jgi:hypothetical protein
MGLQIRSESAWHVVILLVAVDGTIVEKAVMADSVVDILHRLRFSSGPVETLALNETRVRENFIGQLGAIESFTRAATKKGGAETPFVKLTGEVSSEATVNWDLSDPIAQALVLRAALESQGSLHGLDDVAPGHYIISSGVGAISRYKMLDDLHRERLQDHPGLYEQLEAERAQQENIMLMTGGPNELLWLLTIDEGASVCAATLEGSSLRDPFRHWAYADSPWELFALCRRSHESGVPWLAPLHLRVKF